MDRSDVEWATQKLKAYAAAMDQYFTHGRGRSGSGALAGALEMADTVSRITQRLGLGPLSTGVMLADHAENNAKALRAVGALADAAEVDQHLGPAAPQLSAGRLHVWVWGAAQQHWESGHYRDAVHAAAKSINGRVQALVGRRDVADNDLMKQALNPADPKPDAPRLRVPGDHTSSIVRGQQEALMMYAAGSFGVIRNPAAHGEDEWDEQFALERLASLSVLAHEIEQSTVVTAPE